MSILETAKQLGLRDNVFIRVIDQITGKVVGQRRGHNSATQSMLFGMGRYLAGYGTVNQSRELLLDYVPKYMSLGTMGLRNQDCDINDLPTGIGASYADKTYADLTQDELDWLETTASSMPITAEDQEALSFHNYMEQAPGFGADGWSASANNGREYFGLGPMYDDRPNKSTSTDAISCELISNTFPRTLIAYRDIVPATYAEKANTIEVIYSSMISTGALKQFRGDHDYIFITEVGLWSNKTYDDSNENGMLAGYRLAPSDDAEQDMHDPANREALRNSILRVGKNQVVQVIWKIQLGSVQDFSTISQDVSDIHWIYHI